MAEIKLARMSPHATVMEGRRASVRCQPALGIVKVQTLAGDPDAWLRQTLGVAAPRSLREVMVGSVACSWLAPGEWLLTGPEPNVEALRAQCDDHLALAIDLSQARVAFELSGEASVAVMSAHCPLDLSATSMPVGAAKRSVFSDASVFVSRKADRDGSAVFHLIFDQTVARYAARMLAGTLADFD